MPAVEWHPSIVTDLRDNRVVALKFPHPDMEADPFLFDHFQREAGIGERLDHPKLMRVLGSERCARNYLVMEWCEGRSLRKILDEGRIHHDRAIRIVIRLLARVNIERDRGALKPSHSRRTILLLPVAGGAQTAGDFLDADVISGANHLGATINPGRSSEDGTTHAPVDDALVLHVIEREDAEYHHAQDDEGSDRRTNDGIFQMRTMAPAITLSAADRFPVRDFNSYSHLL